MGFIGLNIISIDGTTVDIQVGLDIDSIIKPIPFEDNKSIITVKDKTTNKITTYESVNSLADIASNSDLLKLLNVTKINDTDADVPYVFNLNRVKGILKGDSSFTEFVYESDNLLTTYRVSEAIDQIFSNSSIVGGNYYVAIGNGDYRIFGVPDYTQHTEGAEFKIKFVNPNVIGVTTLDVNGIGERPLVHTDNTPVIDGEIVSNSILTLIYDGDFYRILNGLPGVSAPNILAKILTVTSLRV